MKVLPKIEPMKLSAVPEPFDHENWIFELKHDGCRAVAYINESRCKLVSRRNNAYKSFESLREAIGTELRAQDAILDGEIVCLDSRGHSVFKDVLYRRGQPVFYAFELVWINGRDLRQKPLIERKKLLRRLIQTSKHSSVIYAWHLERIRPSLVAPNCAPKLICSNVAAV
jgi:bifunctional non-homologous end joining protein LigD